MTITIREPGSALTHFAGAILAIFAAFPLLIKAAIRGNALTVTAMAVFMSSMFLLYCASTLYHSISLTGAALKKFRKMDHMMIFVLIAGSYTPVCMLSLEQKKGRMLLFAIWGLALTGMAFKAFWITCPKWLSSIIYIGMGWTCVFVFGDLLEVLSAGAFGWLLAGGIIYTAGGLVYALKIPLFSAKKYFGNHELFHLFVLGGSICHFICMFCYLV